MTGVREPHSPKSILANDQPNMASQGIAVLSEATGNQSLSLSHALRTSDLEEIREKRSCWICFACEDEEDSPDDELVNPCCCKGSTKWAHQICLNRWIDEVQAEEEIPCPICRTSFVYEFRTPSFFFRCLSRVDTCYAAFCGTIARGDGLGWLGLGLLIAAYAIHPISYVMANHVMASLETSSNFTELALALALALMYQLGLCLHLIGTILLEEHLRSWENRVVRWISSNDSSTTDVRRTPLPSFFDNDNVRVDDIIVAVLFPTMGDAVGHVVYGSLIPNNFRRYLMGSLTFILCRGILKVIYKRQRQRKRKVKNREQ